MWGGETRNARVLPAREIPAVFVKYTATLCVMAKIMRHSRRNTHLNATERLHFTPPSKELIGMRS